MKLTCILFLTVDLVHAYYTGMDEYPYDTTSRGPYDTASPGPYDTPSPGPYDTASPGPSDTASPSPITASPGPEAVTSVAPNLRPSGSPHENVFPSLAPSDTCSCATCNCGSSGPSIVPTNAPTGANHCALPPPPPIGGANEGSMTYCTALKSLMCSNKVKKICAGELKDDIGAYHGRYGIRYGEALVDGAGDVLDSCWSIPFNIIDPEDGPFDDVSLKKCWDGFDQTTKCLIALRGLIKIQENIRDRITRCNNRIRTEWTNRCSGKNFCRDPVTNRVVACENFTRTYGFQCPRLADIVARPQCNWPNANMPKPAICTK